MYVVGREAREELRVVSTLWLLRYMLGRMRTRSMRFQSIKADLPVCPATRSMSRQPWQGYLTPIHPTYPMHPPILVGTHSLLPAYVH